MSVGYSQSLYLTENLTENLTEIEQRALSEFVARLQGKLDGHLLSVILFGSRARGEGGPDSDLDVLVIVDRDDLTVRQTIRYLAADIWLEYGPFISSRVWSRERMERMEREPTLLSQNIQRDGIVMLPDPMTGGVGEA